MLIDCDTCAVRGAGCNDCVISVFLGLGEGGGNSNVDLDESERSALTVIAGCGLVPPLRLEVPCPEVLRPEVLRPEVLRPEVLRPEASGREAHPLSA